MRRRETYSTSGPRIILRSFAGRYPENLCDNPAFVAEGYDKGVPMGGDLAGRPDKAKAPTFMVQAEKDADAANLVAKVVKASGSEVWAGTTVSTLDNQAVPRIGFTASACPSMACAAPMRPPRRR